MIPVYSTSQVREIDNYAISDLKIPSIVLMENAALEIFHFILNYYFNNKNNLTVGLVCGKGNNGGDGFAVARHLTNLGFNVKVLHSNPCEEMSADCKTNFQILQRITLTRKNLLIKKINDVKDVRVLKNCDIIIDALLGSGFSGDLKTPYDKIVKVLNSYKVQKIAVDIPTGLNADTGFTNLAFKADYTITLGELKSGLFFNLGPFYSGEIIKGNLGISENLFDKFSPTAYLIEPEDVLLSLPIKPKNLHKYSSGKVLTIAGSGSLPGAAVLTAKSVLRIGAGASILAFPKSVRHLIHRKLSEVVVNTYEDHAKEYFSIEAIDELKPRINWADVTAIGPGLGKSDETQKAVLEILKRFPNHSMVIDADAISALANKKYKEVNLRNKILTPHQGEFSNLIGVSLADLQKNILNYGRNFALDTKAFLVLKGSPTIIFTPKGEVLINTVGNPGLAKFGSGDVLTGVVAGLLSQAKDGEKALVAGVYLHSLTADLLLPDLTEYSFTAEDMIKELPKSIIFLRKSLAATD